MNIRLATVEDASDVRFIYAKHVTDSAVSFEYALPSLQEIENRIRKSFSRHVFIVMESSTNVVGFAYASDFRSRQAYQWIAEVSVYVGEEFKRRGVARSLYTVLHKILRYQGYCQVKAVMTSPNPESQQFHEAMGYKLEAHLNRIGFKFNKWHNVDFYSMVLSKSNTPHPIIPISEIPDQVLRKLLNLA